MILLFFEIACFCQSTGLGINSRSVTALVLQSLDLFRDHPREVIKVVSYSRWSLNEGSIRLYLEGVLNQNSGLLKQWIT